ncbi:hypothetical protein [Streptomyces sp. NBC_00212]|uniref:hypothetical protein n=1 Tax=Streptomyces sp. NBC_00212 TaxID=2975684 RepID=UPI00324A7C6A
MSQACGYVDERGSPGELVADLTVGCDGRDSVVAREAGLFQDAVAADRILAGPLHQRSVTARELGRVQRRRELPVAVVQKQQRGEHDLLLKPALDGTLRGDRLPLPLRLVRRFPVLRGVTAYLGGIGIRPERAPQFACRKG